jgi:hypothetical protein
MSILEYQKQVVFPVGIFMREDFTVILKLTYHYLQGVEVVLLEDAEIKEACLVIPPAPPYLSIPYFFYFLGW